MPIKATLFTDPACPWAYSASPALAVLRWRYRDGLDWELVTIGLAEDPALYEQRGYTPEGQARSNCVFRDRFGMPFSAQPRARVIGTGRACRAIVAARLEQPGSEWAVLRALQLAWFTSDALLDEDDALARALGQNASELSAALDSPETEQPYQDDLRRARSAAGGPTAFQGKAATAPPDGAVRYTAPSLVFEAADGRRLEAGGFQPLEAYDVLIANLEDGLDRHQPPEGPQAALELYPSGLCTQEVAAIMAANLAPVDRTRTEGELIALVAAGEARRVPLAGDALWLPTA